MSTHAIIKVEGVNYTALYKHSDGYPINTLEWLKEFQANFQYHRGDDPEYRMAQLVRSSADDLMQGKYGLACSRYIGWGMVPYGVNYGEEYRYTLHRNGDISWEEVSDSNNRIFLVKYRDFEDDFLPSEAASQ